MKKNVLSKEDLPAFIYLIDQIISYDSNSERGDVQNIYKLIATEGVGHRKVSITDKTIRRAFNLRENLREGHVVFKDFNKPQLNTLNVLTLFYFQDEKITRFKRFKAFKKAFKIEINEYYKSNKPSNEIIDLVFRKTPEKITFLEENKGRLEEVLDMVTKNDFEKLKMELENSNQRFKAFQKEVSKDLKLQEELIEHLKQRIIKIEKERKRANFLFRIFGSLGLFIAPISNYNIISTEDVISNFIDGYFSLDEDDLVDNLM